MHDHPAFIFHSLDHALCVAQKITQTEMFAILFSARGAAKSLGPDVFISMINKVFEHYPEANIIGVLDCADNIGSALNAIRRGVPHISVELDEDDYEKILSIANQSSVSVKVYPDNALDLIKLEHDNPSILCHLMEHY